jgi:DNA-directed RNA polymerase subunit RPC12/RpoP
MYYCAKCKQEYDEFPESKKCKVCAGRIFYKKRLPITKKIKAN